MITNLLCTISVLLSTNEAVHWPQKFVGMVPNPSYASWAAGKHTHPYTLEYCPEEIQQFGDDTNADTKSVETTVTGSIVLTTDEKWIGFFEVPHHFYEGKIAPQTIVLTNWTQEHFQVEYRRVRTNLWFKAGMDADGLVTDLQGALQISHQWDDNKRLEVLLLKSTNWFEPVATNRNFAQGFNFTNTTTFQPMVVTNSNGTNYPLGWPFK